MSLTRRDASIHTELKMAHPKIEGNEKIRPTNSDKFIGYKGIRKLTDKEMTIQTPAFSRRSFKKGEDYRLMLEEELKEPSNIFDDSSPFMSNGR